MRWGSLGLPVFGNKPAREEPCFRLTQEDDGTIAVLGFALSYPTVTGRRRLLAPEQGSVPIELVPVVEVLVICEGACGGSGARDADSGEPNLPGPARPVVLGCCR